MTSLFTANQSYAIADPTVNGASITPSPATYPNPLYPNAGLSTFQFQISNGGSSTSSAAVSVTISLVKLAFNDGSFDLATDLEQVAGSTPFTWSWNAAASTLTGTLNGSFPQFGANTFRIKNLMVTAASSISTPNIGGNVNVVAPGAVNASTTNDVTNAYTYSMAPLPVTLLSFEAHKESGCRAGLSWTVSNAENFNHFDVEQSADGIEYSKVGAVAWQNGQTAYNLVVDQPMNKGYYRLKMVDKDKAYQYSEVRTLRLDCAGGADAVSLYPNPVEKGQGYTLEYNSTTAGKVQYIVTDAIGKVYERRVLEVAVGNNHYALSTATMAAGTYFVQLQAAGDQNRQVLKLIVK